MTLQELAELVEGAEGPSRELDRLIKEAVGDSWDYAADWGSRGHDQPVAKAYTASLDAAMSLVPEGIAELTVRSLPVSSAPHHFAYIRRPFEVPFTGNARSPALALCAASLKALSKREGEDG